MSESKEKISLTEQLGLHDMQAIIALIVISAFMGGILYALFKSTTIQDIQSVLNMLAVPASLIVGFYFGKKAAE